MCPIIIPGVRKGVALADAPWTPKTGTRVQKKRNDGPPKKGTRVQKKGTTDPKTRNGGVSQKELLLRFREYDPLGV